MAPLTCLILMNLFRWCPRPMTVEAVVMMGEVVVEAGEVVEDHPTL